MKKILISLFICLILVLSACSADNKMRQTETSTQVNNFIQNENQSSESSTTDNSLLDKINYNLYTEKVRQIIASCEKVSAKLIGNVSENCNLYGIDDVKIKVEDIGGDEPLAEYTIYKDDVAVCRIQLTEGVFIGAGVDVFYADITKDGEKDIIIQPGDVGTFSAKHAFAYDLKNNTQIDIYEKQGKLTEDNKEQLKKYLDDSFYSIFPDCEWVLPFNIYVDESGDLYYDMAVGKETVNTLGNLMAKAVYNKETKKFEISDVFYAKWYSEN